MHKLVLSFCLLFLLVGGPSDASVFKIKAKQHSIENQVGKSFFETNRFGSQDGSHDIRLETNNGKKAISDLSNYMNAYLIGTINVGTPGKDFDVLFDFLARDSWLMDKQLNTSGAVVPKQKYIPGDSTSFVNTTATLVNDLIKGYVGSDIYKVGDVEPILFHQSFGIARDFLNAKTKIAFDYYPIDGVLSLSASKYTPSNVSSLLANILAQTKQPVVTLWMERLGVSQNAQITFGGVDEENCDADWQTTKRLDMDGAWAFRLESVNINGKAGAVNQSRTISQVDVTDTRRINQTAMVYDSAFFVLGPEEHIQWVAEQVGANLSTTYMNITYHVIDNKDIDPSMNITFNIGDGSSVSMASTDYLVPSPWNRSQHLLTFQGFPTYRGAEWIMGSRLLNSNCVKMDMKEGMNTIGFAKSKK